jgi:hypothetical protein
MFISGSGRKSGIAVSICKIQQTAKAGIEVKCKKRLFITTHYRFFILLTGIAVIIVLQILSRLSQQKQIDLLEAIREAKTTGTVLVVERLMEIQEAIEEVHGDVKLSADRLTEIQDVLEDVYRYVKLSAERTREGEIITMLTEQMVNEYTENALEYFRDEDYGKAARDFNRALRYRRRNTTLMFYHIYSLYLGQQDRTLTVDELTGMQARIRELQERGFREEERIGFSVAEMEQKAQEMRYNIGEHR